MLQSSGKKRGNTRRGKKGDPPKLLSAMTLQKIVDFFKQAAESEKKAEILKQMLAEDEEFTPKSLFLRLDRNRRGYITEDDLQAFFQSSGNPLKSSELKLLFGKLDRPHLGRVTLIEFQNFILPLQNPKLRYFTVRRPVIIPKQGDRLNPKI